MHADSYRSELRILVVDDSPENVQLLEELLSSYGYTVVAAANGIEALERLNSTEIHLIISDVMMPKMDGFQLCRTIRSHPGYATLPFLMYTGDYIDEEDHEFAKSIGVDKYVVKSGGFDELIESVNDVALNWYGYGMDVRERTAKTIDESSFLQKHHEILLKKLEEKMHHLELYAASLNEKNVELQASEARYRSLFENANIGIVILDRKTRSILDANKEALSLFKFTKDEMLAMDSLPIKEDERKTGELLYTELYFSGEATVIDKNGTFIETHVNSVPIAHAQDPRIVVYIRDLSEHAKLRRKLLQIENMTLMGRLAAGIAHEIRNPLAAVNVNLQYLLKQYADNTDIVSTVKMALEGTSRMEHVIEKTLSLARATPPQTKPVDITEIIEHVLWFMKIPLSQKRLFVKKECSPELPFISVDDKQIQQVLLNVLQNAVDASTEAGSIHIRTYLYENGIGQKVCVEITDNGPGIPEHLRETLFEPFHTTKKGGTGLGLALSKYIIDRHNAEIEVDSQVNCGTTIRLKFPALSATTGET